MCMSLPLLEPACALPEAHPVKSQQTRIVDQQAAAIIKIEVEIALKAVQGTVLALRFFAL